MQELMGQMSERQVTLSLELAAVMGPNQEIKDLCYSQPDTFWYCTRLMERVESIVADHQPADGSE